MMTDRQVIHEVLSRLDILEKDSRYKVEYYRHLPYGDCSIKISANPSEEFTSIISLMLDTNFVHIQYGTSQPVKLPLSDEEVKEFRDIFDVHFNKQFNSIKESSLADLGIIDAELPF